MAELPKAAVPPCDDLGAAVVCDESRVEQTARHSCRRPCSRQLQMFSKATLKVLCWAALVLATVLSGHHVAPAMADLVHSKRARDHPIAKTRRVLQHFVAPSPDKVAYLES